MLELNWCTALLRWGALSAIEACSVHVAGSRLQITANTRGIMKIHLPHQASQVFLGVVIRCGPRDTVTVFSRLDECVLFRGCVSVSSCEAKSTSLCLPVCCRCGDPVLPQLCAMEWCWSSHAGPAICCLYLLSWLQSCCSSLTSLLSHLTWLPRDWTFHFWPRSYTRGSVSHLWLGGGACKVLPLVCILSCVG